VIRIQINENEAVGACDTHETRRKACSLLVQNFEGCICRWEEIMKRILRLRWKGVERTCLV